MNDIIEKSNSLIGEKYYYTKHKSGLDIYLMPKKLTTSYAILGVKYGSLYDRFVKGNGETVEVPSGIAHFLEHKMFENEDGVDTFERFAALGAQANAYTSFDVTAYLFSCTDNFSQSLDVLLDFVTHPYFTDETVNKEQGIIAQEIRMGEDSPGRALIFEMLKSLYHVNNVKNEIAGTVGSIAEITAPLLYDCYNTFYNLNNMALCVAGDRTMEEVLASADRVLKESPAFSIEPYLPSEPEEVVRDRYSRSMQVASPLFAVGVKNSMISDDPRERMKQSAAISVIFDTLFGKSSDFYNGLYGEGKVNGTVDIWSEHNRAFSFVCLSGEAKDPEVVYSEFKKVARNAAEHGLDPDDFRRCKRVMYSGFVSSFDSTEEMAGELLDYLTDGGDMLDYTDVCASLDIEYTNGLARELFRESHYTLMTVLPLEEEKE